MKFLFSSNSKKIEVSSMYFNQIKNFFVRSHLHCRLSALKSIFISSSYLRNQRISRIHFVLPGIDYFSRTQRPQHLFSRLSKYEYFFYLSSRNIISSFITFNFIFARRLANKLFYLYCPNTINIDIHHNFIDKNLAETFINFLFFIVEKFDSKEVYLHINHPNWLPVLESIATKSAHKEIKLFIIYDLFDNHNKFDHAPHNAYFNSILTKKVDYVICSSEFLFKYAKRLNRNVSLISNGVDVSFFKSSSSSKLPQVLGLFKKTNKPIIGYYGAIAEWFDAELIKFCAINRPNYHFVFVGHISDPIVEGALKGINNIAFTGEIPYRYLPQILKEFDVCLIPFKLTPLIKATDPVKFYEYISQSKPIVSTMLPQLKKYNKYVYLCNNNNDFLRSIDEALIKGTILSSKMNLKLAKRNDWDVKAGNYMSIIRRLAK